MKNKTNKLLRILSLLLVVFVLLGTVACKDEPSGTTDTTTNGTTETPETPEGSKSFTPSHDYSIVYSEIDAGHDMLNSALSRLSNALDATYDIATSRNDDYYRPAQGLVPDEYEILIGGTNRPQSQAALADLALNDYTYSIESENVIVICGGSIAATVEAINAFCTDVLGYTEGESTDEAPALKIGTTHTHRVEYGYGSATLNGIPLSEWTIAVGATNCAAELADTIRSALGRDTGERIKTVLTRNLTGEEKNLIVTGAIGRELQSTASFAGCLYRVEQDETGTVLSLTATNTSLHLLRAHLEDALDRKTEGNDVAFTLDAEEYLYFDVEEDIDPWILVSEHREEICEGVTYLEQVYRDDRNRPYRTYALFLDPNKVEFITGTSGDGYDCALDPEKRQNTQQHMEAAVKNGKNVIAGINTNFFAINGDYSPGGIVIKDGVLIHGPENGGFFGVTKDGRLVLENQNTYYSSVADGTEFLHAVSGNPILLLDGMLTRSANAADVHPRSAIGIMEDGTIILGVIDGRQENHSNGASLARTALWMRSLGAVNAMNFDGGGSSNLIIRDAVTDTYTVCNSPSDGELRKIHTSLLVKLKENE